MFTNADNYAVIFPSNATFNDKALFIAATILLDFRYFEEKVDIRGYKKEYY